MKMLLFAALLACGSPAEAGDLWMTVDHQGPSDTIKLHLPGNWLTEADEPIWVDGGDQRFDLRAEAIDLKARKVGSEKSWTLDSEEGKPVTLVLQTKKLTGPMATKVGVQTRGPKGNGLTMTMELEPDQLDPATNHLDGVLDVDGFKVDLNKALCDQLKASPGVVLLETTGPKGGGITIDTH